MVKILYFASIRERMGRSEDDFPLPSGVETVGDLLQHLQGRDPAAASALARTSTIRAAVNQEFADTNAPIRDVDEVAFFPPVTGG